jgi:hypothetical protein
VITCELRDDSRVGASWDVQILENGGLVFGQRCPVESGTRFVAASYRRDFSRAGGFDRRDALPSGSLAIDGHNAVETAHTVLRETDDQV